MNAMIYQFRKLFFCCLVLALPAILYAQQGKSGKETVILNFYADNGFQHSSKMTAVAMVEALGKKNNWKILSSNDPNSLNSELLSTVSLVVFNNNCGNNGRIMNDAQQQAFQQYIRKGGSFVGIHCAGAIWNEGEQFQGWYEDLVGARMVNHPAVQEAKFMVETKDHAATKHLPDTWMLKDEIHTFSSNPRRKTNILISVDEDSYSGTPKMGGDHPMVWYREFENGRSFFAAPGHTEETYQNKDYQSMIEGGMIWAMGKDEIASKPKHSDKSINKKGLLVDLNADYGYYLNDSSQVIRWDNQSGYKKAETFVKNDINRKWPCEGCPGIRLKAPEINGHNTIVFREDELVNHNEDAFDHLTSGSGYTFFSVMMAYPQIGRLKDVNSFMGNLRNGGKYEGFWAGFSDSNQLWVGARNAVTIGRWDSNNPYNLAPEPLEANKYYLVMGRMGAGTGLVDIDMFVNDTKIRVGTIKYPANSDGNASKLSIGQERDAVQHPGFESFDGEISRFLLYERPLSEQEMTKVAKKLIKEYRITVDRNK